MTELTHDAADDGFHEIQLSGKQLVFLFMATTVVSIVIFLCGVLVGRGVRPEHRIDVTDTTAATVSPAVTNPPNPTAAETPPAEPPAAPNEGELTYQRRLEAEGMPDDRLKAQGGKPDPRPAVPAATAATPVAQGTRPGKWVVQLVALKDRAAAASIADRLAKKGYPAYVAAPAAGAPVVVYRVQVGRYADRREAEQIARRLQKEEQFQPWISR